jgi:arginine decarboxylase
MWKAEDSIELYGIEKWGNGYFSVNEKGNVVVLPNKNLYQSVDIMDLIEEIEKSRDLEFPVLLRFPQMLEDRIDEITGAFMGAIEEFNYSGTYQPIFPMKVNQRKEVIEYIIKYGAKHKIGMEVGTKAELLAALSLGLPRYAPLICNGYKDEDYLRLALSIHNLNNIIIVVDLFEEIYDILKYADAMGVVPRVGMRVKLFARGSGRWVESGGESAKFGLSTSEALELMRILEERGLTSSLKMLHFHIGSQITDIRTVKNAMNEAARVYAKARKMADIEYLNVGGGLSVDYNGSNTATPSSANYSLQEYANDIVYTVQKICDDEEVPCPTIVSESGRAIAAYHSMLIFKIIGRKNAKSSPLRPPDDEAPMQIDDLCSAFKEINIDNYKEHYHDALQYRDELYDSFNLGNIGLEERAKGETLFWMVCKKAAFLAKEAGDESDEFLELKKLVSQKYIGNFSLFQSVPDMWGVEQIFQPFLCTAWMRCPANGAGSWISPATQTGRSRSMLGTARAWSIWRCIPCWRTRTIIWASSSWEHIRIPWEIFITFWAALMRCMSWQRMASGISARRWRATPAKNCWISSTTRPRTTSGRSWTAA